MATVTAKYQNLRENLARNMFGDRGVPSDLAQFTGERLEGNPMKSPTTESQWRPQDSELPPLIAPYRERSFRSCI